MADAKTTALTDLPTLADADIIPIVDDVAGTPVTKKATIANVFTGRNIVGATMTGVFDAGAATSFEIPNSATPTVDAAGEIAVDTAITDHTGMLKYHDGVEELVVVAMPTANLVATDTYVVSYNAANNEFTMTANGSSLPVDDATAVVKGSADATKLVRIEADGITTGTTRVITMPDANVDLGALAITTGDVYTGVHDFGGAGSLEIPNSATPTVDAAGEIAVDTTITDHTGLIKYHDGVEELTVIALPTANLLNTDAYVVTYNAANNEFEMTTKAGAGMADLVDDVTPQLGGMLDVNGQSIGDGSLELLIFTETASAVNELTVANAATGNDPTITASGDDANIGIDLISKGTGVVQADGVEVVTLSATQSLSNKTIAGATMSGVLDASAATSFAIPKSATPTVNADGEIAIDTTITDHKGLIKYYSTEEMVVVAMPLANLISTDNYVIGYDAASDSFEMIAAAAGGDVVDDTSPQLGGQLDVNGNAIGNGTLELIAFVETGSAVNEITITNAATGNGPTITATGDDANVDLSLTPKATGDLILDGLKWPQADGTNTQVIQTNGSGQLSFVAAASGSDTWGADQNSAGFNIDDTNGNELLAFGVTAGAVNELTITNAATTFGPELSVTGGDTNTDMNIAAKGTGTVRINSDVLLTNDTKLKIDDSASEAPFNIVPRAVEPTSPTTNDIYLDDGSNTTSTNYGWRVYDGAAWQDILG